MTPKKRQKAKKRTKRIQKLHNMYRNGQITAYHKNQHRQWWAPPNFKGIT